MPYVTHAQKQLISHGFIYINPNTFGYADDLISIIKVDLNKENPMNQISNILNVYEDFSKISGLKNNASKTVYGFIADMNNYDIKDITAQLSEDWGANSENFKFKGDVLPFLGDTLVLGRDENRPNPVMTLAINSSLTERLEKIKKTIDS